MKIEVEAAHAHERCRQLAAVHGPRGSKHADVQLSHTKRSISRLGAMAGVLMVLAMGLSGLQPHTDCRADVVVKEPRAKWGSAEAALDFMTRQKDTGFVACVCRIEAIELWVSSLWAPATMPISIAHAQVLSSFANCREDDALEITIRETAYREGSRNVYVHQSGNMPTLKAGDEIVLIGARPEKGGAYYDDERLRNSVMPSYIGYLEGGYADAGQIPMLATKTYLPKDQLEGLPSTKGVVDLSQYYLRQYEDDTLTVGEIGERCARLIEECRSR